MNKCDFNCLKSLNLKARYISLKALIYSASLAGFAVIEKNAVY